MRITITRILFFCILIFSIYAFTKINKPQTINRADYAEPLTKIQVQNAIFKNYPEIDIRRICFRKGGDAGEFGYYFIEFNPEGYAIMPNDARLCPWFRFKLRDKTTYVNYYKFVKTKWYIYNNELPFFVRTFELQLESFINKITGNKNANQLFFEKINKTI